MIEAVFRITFAILCWLVFIPVGFVLATPVVFFLAICRTGGSFKGNVRDEYQRLWNFWKEWGIFVVPPW